jgi:UDP-3-O-[3-hydroxymyristoyl] glucosamine N-acyltransferase
MRTPITGLSLSCAELADRLGGSLRNCPGDRSISEVKPLEEAQGSALSFLANPKYRAQAMTSAAGIILVDSKTDLGDRPQLVMPNPYWGFAQAIGWFHADPRPDWSTQPVHPTAEIGPDCRIAPGATIGARTVLGAGSCVHPGVHIAEDCVLGEGCELFPGVILYRRTCLGDRVRIHGNAVLGSDGYGYVLVDGRQRKIPQVGWVEVGDDVEIGACTTVDRGVLGPTRIQAGTKVDNQCQIAHNVQIGEHCLIISQTGLSGSVSLGDHVTLAGKVGTVGHIHIGSHTTATGNAMIGKDIPDGSVITSVWLARPHREWLEFQATLHRLPGMLKAMRLQIPEPGNQDSAGHSSTGHTH